MGILHFSIHLFFLVFAWLYFACSSHHPVKKRPALTDNVCFVFLKSLSFEPRGD